MKIVVGIGKLIYNKRHRDPEIGSIPPEEYPVPYPEPPQDESPIPANTELGDIKNDVSRILKDIDTLKNGSVFEKIPAMINLKKDVASLKEDGKQVSLKVDSAKAELETIIDVAKQDVSSVKSALAVMKDGEATRIEKIVAIVPAVKKAVGDAKYLKKWLGDPKSDINALLLLVGGLLGSIKGYKSVKG